MSMIDTTKQRAECARMLAMHAEFEDGYEFRTTEDFLKFVKIARTDWPALIKAHLEAMDEIERLRAAGKVLVSKAVEGWDRAEESDIDAARWDFLLTTAPLACRVFEEGK